jgi:hypothetical protein
MSVRAKFRCDSITITKHDKHDKGEDGVYRKVGTQEMRSVALSPVYGNGDPNHENTKFWNASPSGQITLGMVNLAAAEQFEPGSEYYIDFTKAE